MGCLRGFWFATGAGGLRGFLGVGAGIHHSHSTPVDTLAGLCSYVMQPLAPPPTISWQAASAAIPASSSPSPAPPLPPSGLVRHNTTCVGGVGSRYANACQGIAAAAGAAPLAGVGLLPQLHVREAAPAGPFLPAARTFTPQQPAPPCPPQPAFTSIVSHAAVEPSNGWPTAGPALAVGAASHSLPLGAQHH